MLVNRSMKEGERPKDFNARLGFPNNAQFTDENAACMVISDDIYTMLLAEPFFKTFTKKDIADSKKTTETLLALSADSKQEVDDMIGKALAAGGIEPREPQNESFMYGRAFEDLDGHIWEVMWMDPSVINQT